MSKYTILIHGQQIVLNESNQVIDTLDIQPFQVDITEYYEKILAYYKEQELKSQQPKPEDKSFKIE
jgi:hypothetical protein